MADRRNRKSEDFLYPQFNEIKWKPTNCYKPLGQVLIDKNLVTPEQLDEALKIHWKRGIVLGEVLKELGFLNEEGLLEALKTQETSTADFKPESYNNST